MCRIIFVILLSIGFLCGFGRSNAPINNSAIDPNDCNCHKMNKDGVVVFQCQTLPVANDNTIQVGLGVGSVNNSPYVSVTIRFKDTAIELDKSFELHLWLDNGNIVDLQYLNGGLAQMGNSQVAQGIFPLNSGQLIKLKASNIKVVAIKLTDGLRRSYQVKMNPSLLSDQLKCLD